MADGAKLHRAAGQFAARYQRGLATCIAHEPAPRNYQLPLRKLGRFDEA
jgi:hypothetical protein